MKATSEPLVRTSLDNVENKWLEEIHEQCPGVKLCLVALKCDLRESEDTRQKLEMRGEKAVSYEEVGQHGLKCDALVDFPLI